MFDLPRTSLVVRPNFLAQNWKDMQPLIVGCPNWTTAEPCHIQENDLKIVFLTRLSYLIKINFEIT